MVLRNADLERVCHHKRSVRLNNVFLIYIKKKGTNGAVYLTPKELGDNKVSCTELCTSRDSCIFNV